MSWDSKVLWSEGLFLQPHHFQQSDRYTEALVGGIANRMMPYAWGVSALEIDTDVLKVGQFAIKSCSGLTQDGTTFHVPDSTDHPPALEVPADTKNCVVYLSVPQRRQGALDVDMTAAELSAARYRPAELDVSDTVATSRKEVRLAVGKLRLQFALEMDDLADRLVIPIARIVEVRPDQEVVLDSAFIPSCLDIRAAQPLASLLQELDGLLGHRMTALSERLRQAGNTRGAAELQDFLLLIGINRALPVIRFLSTMENIHPAVLYRDCLALAGEMATFMAPEKHPPQFPSYQHHDLTATFAPVIRLLRQFLSAVLESSAVSIPLDPRKYGISVGVIADRRLITTSDFVLAVKSDVPSETLRRHFAGQAKIGPVEEIRQLVNSALPGISMRPLPTAPRQVPFHSDTVYFEIDGSSPYWGKMTTSGGVALHVSGDYPGLTMEMWAIRKS